MNAPSLDPLSALADATVSVKDALRAARHAMREGRRRMAPPPADSPLAPAAALAARGVDAAVSGCLDAASRAARVVRDHAPLAPARVVFPTSLEAIRALLARGELGRMALAEGGHAALRAILDRLGAGDALVLESPLRHAFDAVTAPGDDARRAADLALALARARAAPQSEAGAQACVALALAVLAASRAQPSEAPALLEAAADMAAAIGDEIAPALDDRETMAALLSTYADHL